MEKLSRSLGRSHWQVHEVFRRGKEDIRTEGSSIQLFVLRKIVGQNDTNVKSLCMQLEKVGRGLLREASRVRGALR